MDWKWFNSKQVKEALGFSSTSIVILESSQKGKERAILLGPDVPKIIEAAKSLGLQSKWLQKGENPHFDLKGDPLREAKRKCK